MLNMQISITAHNGLCTGTMSASNIDGEFNELISYRTVFVHRKHETIFHHRTIAVDVARHSSQKEKEFKRNKMLRAGRLVLEIARSSQSSSSVACTWTYNSASICRFLTKITTPWRAASSFFLFPHGEATNDVGQLRIVMHSYVVVCSTSKFPISK